MLSFYMYIFLSNMVKNKGLWDLIVLVPNHCLPVDVVYARIYLIPPVFRCACLF